MDLEPGIYLLKLLALPFIFGTSLSLVSTSVEYKRMLMLILQACFRKTRGVLMLYITTEPSLQFLTFYHSLIVESLILILYVSVFFS